MSGQTIPVWTAMNEDEAQARLPLLLWLLFEPDEDEGVSGPGGIHTEESAVGDSG